MVKHFVLLSRPTPHANPAAHPQQSSRVSWMTIRRRASMCASSGERAPSSSPWKNRRLRQALLPRPFLRRRGVPRFLSATEGAAQRGCSPLPLPPPAPAASSLPYPFFACRPALRPSGSPRSAVRGAAALKICPSPFCFSMRGSARLIKLLLTGKKNKHQRATNDTQKPANNAKPNSRGREDAEAEDHIQPRIHRPGSLHPTPGRTA